MFIDTPGGVETWDTIWKVGWLRSHTHAGLKLLGPVVDQIITGVTPLRG